MFPKIDFQPETKRWKFWLARIFGRKVCGGIYEWRGKWWIVGEVEDPFNKEEV
jgi:hypothetical protein